jgi:predicted nucleic acid-binding protein
MTPEIARKAGRYVQLGVSGYDACYAALAEELESQWLTFDRKAHQLLADKKISVNLLEGVPAGW